MRDLAIAYGNSRQAKKWSNKTVKFDDLKKRLKTTMYTTESVEEYKKMSNDIVNIPLHFFFTKSLSRLLQ